MKVPSPRDLTQMTTQEIDALVADVKAGDDTHDIDRLLQNLQQAAAMQKAEADALERFTSRH